MRLLQDSAHLVAFAIEPTVQNQKSHFDTVSLHLSQRGSSLAQQYKLKCRPDASKNSLKPGPALLSVVGIVFHTNNAAIW